MNKGLLSAVLCYVMWGLLPLYWKLLSGADSGEILAHRIAWSFVFMIILLLALGKWKDFLTDICMLARNRGKAFLLLTASLLISFNWLLYIWAVNNNHIVDTSLGYYINPLLSVLLGVVYFRERLTGIKKLSIALAFIGISLMTWNLGMLPWISLALALSFALYGAVKKKLAINPLTSITLETLFVMPVVLPYLIYKAMQPATAFGFDKPFTTLLLMGAGVVTATPLVLFSYGANKLPLNVLGFCQYFSPSIALMLGIFVYREPFGVNQFISFSFIWAALIVFSAGPLFSRKQRQNAG